MSVKKFAREDVIAAAIAAGSAPVAERVLSRIELRGLLKIHIANPGPYADIMDALTCTPCLRRDIAMRRCVELWELALVSGRGG